MIVTTTFLVYQLQGSDCSLRPAATCSVSRVWPRVSTAADPAPRAGRDWGLGSTTPSSSSKRITSSVFKYKSCGAWEVPPQSTFYRYLARIFSQPNMPTYYYSNLNLFMTSKTMIKVMMYLKVLALPMHMPL